MWSGRRTTMAPTCREENTKDLPRSWRSKLWDVDNIHRVLEEHPQESTRRLAEELGALKDTIHHHIKTLEKSYRRCRSVPHELTPQQAQHRGDICHRLISNPMNDGFISRIVTHDEKWVYYCNPDASKQWLCPRQPTKVIVKKIGSART